jgi:hypothetical protein
MKIVKALIVILLPLQLWADPMKDFLKSCAYGTASGAVVGLVSLAFTEDPSSKTSNIARGASIGLYVGVAVGIYQIYTSPNDERWGSQFQYLPFVAHQNSFESGSSVIYQYRF